MRVSICLLLLVLACREHSISGSGQSVATVQVNADTATDITSDVPLDPKEEMTEEFMNLINDHRMSIGLDALIHVKGLQDISETHSKNMAAGSVAFGHTGFSERCSLGRGVIGGGNLCAENVAKGQKTVQAAFASWMNSSGHRANIEQPRVTHTGFGFAKSSSGTWYWTQIFLEKN